VPIPLQRDRNRYRDRDCDYCGSRGDNQPAWMTKQEQSSAHDGPTGMPGNIGTTANSFVAIAETSSNHYPSASSGPRTNLPSSSSNISCSCMGCGTDMNLSAWMAQQETASSREFSVIEAASSREFSVLGQQVPAQVLYNNQSHQKCLTKKGSGKWVSTVYLNYPSTVLFLIQIVFRPITVASPDMACRTI
jgi:hypothetical protein